MDPGVVLPAGGVAVPGGGVAVPLGGVAVPGVVPPGVVVPAGGVAVVPGGVADPAGGVAVPAGGVAVPPCGDVAPGLELCPAVPDPALPVELCATTHVAQHRIINTKENLIFDIVLTSFSLTCAIASAVTDFAACSPGATVSVSIPRASLAKNPADAVHQEMKTRDRHSTQEGWQASTADGLNR